MWEHFIIDGVSVEIEVQSICHSIDLIEVTCCTDVYAKYTNNGFQYLKLIGKLRDSREIDKTYMMIAADSGEIPILRSLLTS